MTEAGRRRNLMQERREEFVEPEIVKHQEKLADVTAVAIGSGDIADGGAD
jgi:hypothetical protein